MGKDWLLGRTPEQQDRKGKRADKMRYLNLKAAGLAVGVSVGKDGTFTADGQTFPVDGHTVRLDTQVVTGARTTATRVAAGAVLAGPVGAVVGAVAKKGTSGEAGHLVFTDVQGVDVARVMVAPKDVNAAKVFVRTWMGQPGTESSGS